MGCNRISGRPGGEDGFPEIENRHWAVGRQSQPRRRAGCLLVTTESHKPRKLDRRPAEAGEAVHALMRPSVTAASQRILAPLSAAEADALIGFLSRIVIAHESVTRPGAGCRPPARKGEDRARNA